ncbi:MAG TPA: hypothetical protein VN682_07170 [Terriglobales bacterium]|nr:hypothetical protein [Terriglobales bacterium]
MSVAILGPPVNPPIFIPNFKAPSDIAPIPPDPVIDGVAVGFSFEVLHVVHFLAVG